jgi:type IV pilus assembly protein PilA
MPFYTRYIHKSRLASYVFPGVHIIETGIATYYSARGEFPESDVVDQFAEDADTTFFTPLWEGTLLRITINPGPNDELSSLANDESANFFNAKPITQNEAVSRWSLSGPIALRLGLDGEGK